MMHHCIMSTHDASDLSSNGTPWRLKAFDRTNIKYILVRGSVTVKMPHHLRLDSESMPHHFPQPINVKPQIEAATPLVTFEDAPNSAQKPFGELDTGVRTKDMELFRAPSPHTPHNFCLPPASTLIFSCLAGKAEPPFQVPFWDTAGFIRILKDFQKTSRNRNSSINPIPFMT